MFRSIQTRLAVGVILTTTIVLFLFGLYEYREQGAEIEMQLQEQAERILKRLTKGLPEPMWNLNTVEIDNILRMEMAGKTVLAIQVWEGEGKQQHFLVGYRRGDTLESPPLPLSAPLDRFSFRDTLYDSRLLQRGKQIIGKVDLVLTREGIYEKQHRLIQKLMVEITVTILLLFLALTGLVRRLLLFPLERLRRALLRLSEGDLTERLLVKTQDEIGEIAHAFNTMAERLLQQSKEIREGIEILQRSARQIAETTTQLAATASETASSIMQTTATAEEIRRTSQITMQEAAHVAANARISATMSEEGSAALDTMVAEIQKIKTQMESITQSIMRLSEQTQEVAEIIATVDDIAEQSNLLAVNASMEAVKAGEAGKGFSVVAEEIRALAEQSKDATAQVRAILKGIQKASATSVMVAEQGMKSVEGGVAQSDKTRETIHVLLDGIQSAARVADRIELASREQNQGINQVASSMEMLKHSSQQTAEGAKNLRAISEEIGDLAERLHRLVAKYQI